MRPRRPRARRAMRHPTRLVSMARHERLTVPDEVAQAWMVGIAAAELLYEYFPDFYQATNTDAMSATLPRLLGCCAAFWQLVERRGLKLRWPGEHTYGGLTLNELPDAPEETILVFDGVSEEWMSDLGHFLVMPRPRFYGYGVQALLDQESDNYPCEPLTILLWHLFADTPLGLGVPLLPMATNIDEELAFDLFRIKPLPGNLPVQLFGAQLQLEIAQAYDVPAWDLISYAFGKTTNDLANYDEYEVEAIYMGEIDEGFEWREIDRLAQQQRAAERLEAAYTAWSGQVKQLGALRRLAGQLHRAARAAERELQTAPKSLLVLLGTETEEEAVYAH
ncbi:MAG TPA: hypothetical protein PKK15_11950 [Kouleothrix sp.]|nr:hypothetical protein [Kouleothrix sp.]